jgi:hypothetical protein
LAKLGKIFCVLLIGSNVGVNAKWISTTKNVIADKISRLNRTAAIGAHERQVFDKLLWGLVTSTIFVRC